MSKAFSRTDRSLIGQWWWTIDRSLLFSSLFLLAVGIFLSFSSSPVVAKRIGASPYFFVERHLIYVIPALFSLFFFSMLNIAAMRLMCWAGFLVSFILLILTPLIGNEIKGAVRWIQISFFSIQITEFLKPFYFVVSAWVLSRNWFRNRLKTWLFSTGLTLFILFLVMLQPDFGMTFVIGTVWAVQMFLSGLPLIWFVVLGAGGLIGVVIIYQLFDHVASRVDRFLGLSQQADLYQIQQSLESIKNGGFFGRGPGEGHFKMFLPDAHADFVFAVAVEEFGFILGFIIISFFCFIFFRGFIYLKYQKSLFQKLALIGIIMQYATQMIINISSTLSLIPTKGMTLPFISYGGSSLIGVSIGMGIILCLTREKVES